MDGLSRLCFAKMDSDERVRVKASIFCDCTYEGDFLAAAGIPFRIGRESRSDYGESRAGRIFYSAPIESAT
ncbi:FAD-dependent oxidoreductase [Opitutaceae bacterium TAV3]|nr:FAD-dependent oxidoreductase [Opitutaceae bacterium TAV3]